MENKEIDDFIHFLQKDREEVENLENTRDLNFKNSPSFQNIERISKILKEGQNVYVPKLQTIHNRMKSCNDALNSMKRLSNVVGPYNDILKQRSIEIPNATAAISSINDSLRLKELPISMSELTKAVGTFSYLGNQFNDNVMKSVSAISSIQKLLNSNNLSNTFQGISRTSRTFENLLRSEPLFSQRHHNSNLINLSILSSVKFATKTVELKKLEENCITYKGLVNSLSNISDYVGEFTSQWNNALTLNSVMERSIAVQNIAILKTMPGYKDYSLPRGIKTVLKDLTKETAEELLKSDEIFLDPKERKFFHKDSPDSKLTANQITVVKSSLELFAGFTLDELLSFESKLESNRFFAINHPVGERIYEIINNWDHFVSFENIVYYHARSLRDDQNPFTDSEMMKAPRNVSAHGRYNDVGQSCYYIAESEIGAKNEILKHCRKKPRVQIIGLKAIKEAKLLDLSGDVKGINRFVEHMRNTVENDQGKIIKEYLLPNFVAACCKELGIDGIRYKSSKNAEYNCCVLWDDNYFEVEEGTRKIF